MSKNKSTSYPFQRVCIEWADAHANEDGSWVYLKNVKDEGEYLVTSVGWLIPVGEGGQSGHATLAQSVGFRDGVGDHLINIPIGMIRRAWVLGHESELSFMPKRRR